MSTVRFPAFKLATPEKLGWGEDSRFLVEKVSVALWTIHLVCSYTKTCFRGKSYSINQMLPKFTHCPAATRGKKSWQNISAWQKPDVQWCAYTHQNVTPKTHRGQESTAQRCMGSLQSSLDVFFLGWILFCGRKRGVTAPPMHQSTTQMNQLLRGLWWEGLNSGIRYLLTQRQKLSVLLQACCWLSSAWYPLTPSFFSQLSEM